MAFLINPALVATTGDDSAADSSITALTSEVIPVGAVLRASCSSTLAGALSTGATAYHETIEDESGNTWVKVGEVSRNGVPVGESSPTVSFWLCTVTVEIPSGAEITVNFDTDYIARFLQVIRYDFEEEGSSLELVDAAVETFGGGTTWSIDLDLGIDPEDFTWLGVGSDPYRMNTRTITLDADYETDAPTAGNSNSFSNSSTQWNQSRALNESSETWNGSASVYGTIGVLILAAIRVIPPPPPPPEEGTREYQADFETENFGVLRASTERRPDAISLDYRTAFALGPKALEDLSDGLLTWTWKARAEGDSIYLSRENSSRSAWGEETLLVTIGDGIPIDELDFAFEDDGRIVCVWERATGTDGAPQVMIYYFERSGFVLAYTWTQPTDGKTPRCVTDSFPVTVGPHVCPPEIHVQVVYLKPDVGMVRLESSDRFVTEYDTPLGWSANRYLEEFARTEDRRLSVVYSQRTPGTGRYALSRVDSVPARDSLLPRPSFIASAIYDEGDYLWATPLTTESLNLAVYSEVACDAYELQASASFPTGDNPPFEDYADEDDSGFPAGYGKTFSVPLTHGAGTLSLVAFRARIRRVIDEVTCYSPWRYLVIPNCYPGEATDDDSDSVNCDADFIWDLPAWLTFARHGLVEGVRLTSASARLPGCYEPIVTAATYPTWFFCGGQWSEETLNFRKDCGITRRAYEPLSFSDEDGEYNGRVISRVLSGGGIGAPRALDWAGYYRIPMQFPDDTGQFPDEPVANDIIGDTG